MRLHYNDRADNDEDMKKGADKRVKMMITQRQPPGSDMKSFLCGCVFKRRNHVLAHSSLSIILADHICSRCLNGLTE